MIFGKYINKYYLKNAPILILGLAALILVDYFQLFIPELYRMVINGMNGDPVLVNGQAAVFDMEFLLDQVCRPMIITIIVMVVGRFLWRVCFFRLRDPRGDRSSYLHVRAQQGAVPGVLSGQQSRKPDESLHERSRYRAGVLRRRYSDVLRCADF